MNGEHRVFIEQIFWFDSNHIVKGILSALILSPMFNLKWVGKRRKKNHLNSERIMSGYNRSV